MVVCFLNFLQFVIFGKFISFGLGTVRSKKVNLSVRFEKDRSVSSQYRKNYENVKIWWWKNMVVEKYGGGITPRVYDDCS